MGQLTELDPTIDVRPDDRYVDDGDMVTSTGVSAGIDMALHLVSRLGGVDHAHQVARNIQYDHVDDGVSTAATGGSPRR
jgi:transcriptional regulator GlxA family with amidase domain